MPRGDRTGPNGMGPMTGRGAGFCGGYHRAGFLTPPGAGMGRGMGGGFGGGRGRRNRYYATGLKAVEREEMARARADSEPMMSQDDELAMLRQQAREMQQTLGNISRRIDDLAGNETE